MKIKAHAKVNIFLKIVGTRGEYHLLSSRFMQLKDLYDTISFKPSQKVQHCFRLEGTFGCSLANNTIYKAYHLLNLATGGKRLASFFKEHYVAVEKRIPEFAGLGGGSSDAAAFLRLANSVCDLKVSTQELAEIGKGIGADVPFFVYDYPSANVSGIGEIVTPFEEEQLTLKTVTPDIACDTAAIYKMFRERFLQNIQTNAKVAKEMESIESKALLQRYERAELNDLYAPALALCPDLKAFSRPGWFFSGSGSTFFKIEED
jgi:4-diphosphocytidyl-2-C-methyl-D-erythritol kinase